MMDIFLSNPCGWSTAPYLLFSDNIWGNFIYYSHLFPSLTGLLIAIFVFIQNPKGKVNQALLLLTTAFTAWCLIDLVLWASERADLIMFFWSILIHFDLLIYIASFYFVYAFVKNSRPPLWGEAILLSLFIPLALFAHTSLNLLGFDYTNCWREALEGPLWQNYVYNAELLIAIGIVAFLIKEWRKTKDRIKKRELAYVGFGIIAFLISFSLGNITGSIETDWELGQYGLFGMPIFVAFLTYLIVRYQTFNAKLIATEALVAGLGIMILSLMFVRELKNVFAIAFFTLILTTALGMLLIRSVRKEVEQREQIEKLAERLERANKRLKELDKMKSEFVSIASHQLRSPLTSIRGYTSMLLEGSFGKLPQKAADAIERIGESSKYMSTSVEDYLNVSRIQAGNMKYEYSDVNICKLLEDIVDELRQPAVKKGLLLTLKKNCSTKGLVNVDVGKTRQIIHNLINNAIKYTPEGSIKVSARDIANPGRVFIDIADTGVGMNPQTIEKMFEKFQRADNANGVNSSGTGLGLYIARKMAEDMGGSITATSEGEGKGSTFTLELPLKG